MLHVFREWIAPASLVVQLLGRRDRAEPPHPTADFGRVSYTQFEMLEAQRTGKKVIYHFLDDSFPTDAVQPEPAAQSPCRRLTASDLSMPIGCVMTESPIRSTWSCRSAGSPTSWRHCENKRTRRGTATWSYWGSPP